jgi:hypothetical protein
MKSLITFLTLIAVLFFSGLNVWADEDAILPRICPMEEQALFNCRIPGGYFHGVLKYLTPKDREETDFEQFMEESFKVKVGMAGLTKALDGWLNLSELGFAILYIPNYRKKELIISSGPKTTNFWGLCIYDTDPESNFVYLSCEAARSDKYLPTPPEKLESKLKEYRKNWRKPRWR